MGSNAGGFDFELVKRNALLEAKGMPAPKAWKTGTTIAGDGVVLAADTRSTSGSTVADKNCEKIHYIAPNIYCCGAGTAADTENVTAMVSSHLELHKYATGRQARVVTAMTLLKSHLFRCAAASSSSSTAAIAVELLQRRRSWQQGQGAAAGAGRYQGHVSAALILGGVDLHGPHLFTIFPHGSTDALPYATMGSGSLNAMAVFEAGYKDDMAGRRPWRWRHAPSAGEAAMLGEAGVYNDLGSGSNIDLCIISGAGVEYLRNHEYLQGKTYTRQFPVKYAPGTAPVLKEKVSLSQVAVIEGVESMDTDS
ncbi:nucleophile aminohydrolase [Scenedesmus sp. NREL 46B-D3]|nr:nucleophile aminohydrolase [Scenedesmus sp. NREL 46B-D3]